MSRETETSPQDPTQTGSEDSGGPAPGGEVVEPTPDEVERLKPGSAPVPGRLAMLTAMSALVGAIPLPLIPAKALSYVRGAVAYEVLSRHGISLSTDARSALADTISNDRARAVLRTGVEFVARRLLNRLGPLAPLTTIVGTFEIYALGLLLERYVKRVRPGDTLRMHEPEARRVRRAINTAVLRMLYPSTKPRSLMLQHSAEDLRDEVTRWVDTFLLTSATIPSYIERRLEAAFDDVVLRTPELREV